MAYMKKMKNKANKSYYYSLVQGVKHIGSKYHSLDTDNRAVAEVRHSMVEDQEVNIKNGEQIIFPWQSDIGGKTKVVLRTIGSCVETWLEVKDINLRKGSVRRYEVSLNAFMRTLRHKEDEPIRNIKNRTIEEFKKAYKGKHTNVGINLNLRGVKAFLRFVLEEGHIKKMPKIDMLSEPKEKPQFINEFDWLAMMNLESLNDWWKDVFKLYYSTGLRRSETIHGYLDDEFLVVPAEYSKSKVEFEVYLLPWQIDIVKKIHVARDEHLAKGSKMVTFKNKFTKKFQDCCRELGIYIPYKTTLHCLRHTFALMKFLECGNLDWVATLLHHDDTKVTKKHYASFSIRRLKKDFPTYWKKIQEVQKMAQKCDVATQFVATPMPMNYNSRQRD